MAVNINLSINLYNAIGTTWRFKKLVFAERRDRQAGRSATRFGTVQQVVVVRGQCPGRNYGGGGSPYPSVIRSCGPLS